jgi:hypothetical protein
MVNVYFNLGLKNRAVFIFLLFCIGFFQNTYALRPFFEEKSIVEKTLLKDSNQKYDQQQQENTTKKVIFESKRAKSKSKRKKISSREKLSILRLVSRTNSSKKHSYEVRQKKKWNGQHTAGLLSWASVLVAVMAFFTGHLLLGILASCSVLLFLLLIFVEKGSTGTVDYVLWLFAQIINVIVVIGTIFD